MGVCSTCRVRAVKSGSEGGGVGAWGWTTVAQPHGERGNWKKANLEKESFQGERKLRGGRNLKERLGGLIYYFWRLPWKLEGEKKGGRRRSVDDALQECAMTHKKR